MGLEICLRQQQLNSHVCDPKNAGRHSITALLPLLRGLLLSKLLE